MHCDGSWWRKTLRGLLQRPAETGRRRLDRGRRVALATSSTRQETARRRLSSARKRALGRPIASTRRAQHRGKLPRTASTCRAQHRPEATFVVRILRKTPSSPKSGSPACTRLSALVWHATAGHVDPAGHGAPAARQLRAVGVPSNDAVAATRRQRSRSSGAVARQRLGCDSAATEVRRFIFMGRAARAVHAWHGHIARLPGTVASHVHRWWGTLGWSIVDVVG